MNTPTAPALVLEPVPILLMPLFLLFLIAHRRPVEPIVFARLRELALRHVRAAVLECGFVSTIAFWKFEDAISHLVEQGELAREHGRVVKGRHFNAQRAKATSFRGADAHPSVTVCVGRPGAGGVTVLESGLSRQQALFRVFPGAAFVTTQHSQPQWYTVTGLQLDDYVAEQNVAWVEPFAVAPTPEHPSRTRKALVAGGLVDRQMLQQRTLWLKTASSNRCLGRLFAEYGNCTRVEVLSGFTDGSGQQVLYERCMQCSVNTQYVCFTLDDDAQRQLRAVAQSESVWPFLHTFMHGLLKAAPRIRLGNEKDGVECSGEGPNATSVTATDAHEGGNGLCFALFSQAAALFNDCTRLFAGCARHGHADGCAGCGLRACVDSNRSLCPALLAGLYLSEQVATSSLFLAPVPTLDSTACYDQHTRCCLQTRDSLTAFVYIFPLFYSLAQTTRPTGYSMLGCAA
jgi:hypothetical protein